MAYPFRSETHALRQRLLIAIGSGGVLGLSAIGCGSTHEPLTKSPAPQMASGRGASGGSGGNGGSAGTKPLPMTPSTGGAASAGSGGTPGGMMMTAMCTTGSRVERTCYPRADMESKARYGCGQIPKSPIPTDAEVMAAFLPNGCLPKQMACDGCCNPAAVEGEPQGDGSCCYTYCGGACCGRPLIVAGESRLAAVERRADWLALANVDARDPGAVDRAFRARIAAEWREDARMEHASIASFARFTLDLLAFGADSELVELAQRAGLDEIAHAKLCFGLAERYDGQATGPAALDLHGVQPAATLRAAARAAFVEGCIGETQAALLARAALAHATDAGVRTALERIADDEARHAELAYRFVSFALQREPDLRADLSTALQDAFTTSLHAPIDAEPDDLREALHSAGRLTATERSAAMRRALVDVIAPCTRALLGSGCESAPLPAAATLS